MKTWTEARESRSGSTRFERTLDLTPVITPNTKPRSQKNFRKKNNTFFHWVLLWDTSNFTRNQGFPRTPRLASADEAAAVWVAAAVAPATGAVQRPCREAQNQISFEDGVQYTAAATAATCQTTRNTWGTS